jgi:hypothetical protein
MKRATVLLLAGILAACAQPAPPSAIPTVVAPTVTPSATAAALYVDGDVREGCGSIGGCAYFAKVRGDDLLRQTELVDRDETRLVPSGGLPATLPEGDYTLTFLLRAVSDAILNGERQFGPEISGCSLEFTIEPGQDAYRAHVSFARADCVAEATSS